MVSRVVASRRAVVRMVSPAFGLTLRLGGIGANGIGLVVGGLIAPAEYPEDAPADPSRLPDPLAITQGQA